MVEVTPIGDGWYIVNEDGHRTRVAVASTADATWVFMNGQTFRLHAANSDRVRGRSRGDTGVMSPMPATVVAVHAAPGQSVAEGETVVVLEAMKMELPLKSPRSGTVKAIHCAKGDLVQPGVNLVEIE